jgi:hypothetical protein
LNYFEIFQFIHGLLRWLQKKNQNENLYEWISGIFGQISNCYPLQCSENRHVHFLLASSVQSKHQSWRLKIQGSFDVISVIPRQALNLLFYE